jgi:hypothetical protein
LETMEGFEIPLAGWRVHATAAEVSQRAEDTESSQRHREISRAAILQLANSLAPEDPLRKNVPLGTFRYQDPCPAGGGC